MASTFITLARPFSSHKPHTPSPSKRLLGLRSSALKINAIAKKWEPTKVVPQADRVLIRLQDLPEKSSGGVLLPKSAVKFERYLMGEILSIGADVGEVEAGKKVMNHNGSSFCWCSCINNFFSELFILMPLGLVNSPRSWTFYALNGIFFIF
ncbi:10 kDa chaperonin 1, chloroplastic isoform X1 [Vitis vinifera]|uniref:10 kDa chaperonin 1, chloroplastic isoform X1 n=1 Tax=Vitis vinifera TaxID=29760 RepID=UPI00288345CA|nr:10 kDa chaperonin 1, chloroplastic isoform X1 [Vitis vinifera]